MSFSIVTVATELANVGMPSVNEVTPADRLRFSNAVVVLLNSQLRDIAYSFVEKVEGQQEYTLSPVPRTVLKVINSAPVASLAGLSIGDPEFQWMGSIGNSALLSAPVSGWESFAFFVSMNAYLSAWQGLNPASWQFVGDKLQIIPKTTGDGMLAILAGYDFVSTALPDKVRPAVEYLYTAEQLNYLATKRLSQGGVTMAGGIITYPSDKLIQLADKYRELAGEHIKRLQAEQRTWV